LVGGAEVEPEGFGALHHAAHLDVAAEQVVDELDAVRFFLPG